MTDAEIREIAEAAADAAVSKVFLRLGIDPEDPGALPERKADFDYLHRLRVGSELFKKQGLSTIASVITTFIIGALVAAAMKWWPHP